jgi:hypothetical protein
MVDSQMINYQLQNLFCMNFDNWGKSSMHNEFIFNWQKENFFNSEPIFDQELKGKP